MKINIWLLFILGYYPSSSTEEFTEYSPPPEKHNFITKLCYDWEEAATLPSDSSCRSVVVRIGLVLGRDGGAIQSMIWPFWFGLGGMKWILLYY